MIARRRRWFAAIALGIAFVATAAATSGNAGPRAGAIALSSAATAKPIPTSGNDTLTGTTGHDVIDGLQGDDTIDGGSGNDFLVEGQTGNDRIDGGPGEDVIDGGAGNDTSLLGGAGPDIIFGGRGDDTVGGGLDGDRIDAGDGADSVQGGDGDDLLLGGKDSDQLEGGLGDDVLVGGGSGDALDGGLGEDVCYTARDFAVFAFCETIVQIDSSRAGRDLIDETHLGIETGGPAGVTKLQTNREVLRKRISGNDAANVLPAGTDAAEAFKARGGDDVVAGAGGDDDLDCGTGNDVCRGGAGDDNIVGGSGEDSLNGDDGNDVIDGGAGADKIVAGAGDDTIFPGEGDEVTLAQLAASAPTDKGIEAGPGNDRIHAVGGGRDTISCGDGTDTVEYDDADTVADDCEIRSVTLTLVPSRSRTLNARQVEGAVRIRKPGSKTFEPLKQDAPIPVTSDIDTPGDSQVTLSVEVKDGNATSRATATISRGVTNILGPSQRSPRALTLSPIALKPQRGCGRARATAARVAQASARKRRKPRKARKPTRRTTTVRDANGPVAVITRDVIVAAGGTSWTTTQICTGTRVTVTEGVVNVVERGRRKTTRVRAGSSRMFLKRKRR
jgi:Ca2+-binding RTX toxin-like protein